MKIIKQEVQAIADLKAGYNLGHADVAILNELARIALASLEAEAVCVIDQSNLDYLKSGSDADVWPASRTEMGDVLLYRTAPPAPESVPDEMTMQKALSAINRLSWQECTRDAYMLGWNACRAAMLQGAENAESRCSKSPVIPDGWVACSERMPKKNDKVLIFIDFNSEYVPPSIHDAEFTGSTFRRGGATVNVFPLEDGYGVTHWQPLPSHPAK